MGGGKWDILLNNLIPKLVIEPEEFWANLNQNLKSGEVINVCTLVLEPETVQSGVDLC